MKFYLNIWFSLNVYYGQARLEYNCPNGRIASAIYSKCVDILCRVRFLDLVRFAQQLRKFWGFSVSEKNALAAKLHIRSHTFKEVLKLTLDLFYYFLMAVGYIHSNVCLCTGFQLFLYAPVTPLWNVDFYNAVKSWVCYPGFILSHRVGLCVHSGMPVVRIAGKWHYCRRAEQWADSCRRANITL